MKVIVKFFLVLLTLSISATVKAESQQIHSHGLAMLTLAIEGNVVQLELDSPAINLVGFEHKARTYGQKQQVEKTVQLLKLQPNWFIFTGTFCEISGTAVDASSVMADDSHSDHHHHEHEQEQEHPKEASNDSHGEIVASYSFICKDTKKLKAVSIELFNQFPRIEEINVMWVTDSKQGSKLLNPSSTSVSLK